MSWIRGKAAQPGHTPAQRVVCVDGQRAEVLSETDGWMQLRLPDGTIPSKLASRTQPCTCAGKGCPR
ncbi:hypothetical protein ABT352_33420 [Streptosporangium sp. NPDC000563]|uniref:hypothetical protein n=1 Tax=Streptosporangium sp. NPDC000563 TaxID=3154366 RepID=UPI00331EEC64